MTARKRVRLTDAGVAKLKPGRTEYIVWDSRAAGLGVRVRPVGASQLRLARTCQRCRGAGDRRFGSAHDRRGCPAGMQPDFARRKSLQYR